MLDKAKSFPLVPKEIIDKSMERFDKYMLTKEFKNLINIQKMSKVINKKDLEAYINEKYANIDNSDTNKPVL